MLSDTAPSGASNLLNLNGDTVNVGVVGTSAGVFSILSTVIWILTQGKTITMVRPHMKRRREFELIVRTPVQEKRLEHHKDFSPAQMYT